MYATGNKKMLNMLILEILRMYTDENHSLTQQEIMRLLKSNYAMECDRRSVRNNVEHLKELGYDIEMDNGYRLLSREFDDSELRILIDSVLFSKSISTNQASQIIKKLRELGSKYFNAKVSHVSNLPELNRTINKQAMISIDKINDAISEKKKISFVYNNMGTDFKLHPRHDGKPYVVSPYQMVANNGRFYLISNVDGKDNVAHFRIDKMTKVEEVDEKAKPIKDVPELKDGLNLPKHMAEHIYMFAGKSVPITLETTEDMMQQLADWFGKDFTVRKVGDGKIQARVTCNEDAMHYWALQYGPYVEVIKPESLRNRIRDDIAGMAKKYKN